MKERITKLYQDGLLDITGLDRAISKGWITEVEKQEIINSKSTAIEPI